MSEQVGEHFIVGFLGTVIPPWVLAFEREFGLGGVVLYDFDYQAQVYENNIAAPEQVGQLCRAVRALPSRPLVFVDQEGGKVRRLKTERGFAPLPSPLVFAQLPEAERWAIARKSYAELRTLGFNFNLAPVVDVNLNAASPEIGVAQRSFSAEPEEILANVRLLSEVAREVGLGLCLKHFPGLGSSTTSTHFDLTDLTEGLTDDQEEIFYRALPELPGRAIMTCHGFVLPWDERFPVSLSPAAIARLRSRAGEVLVISDDLQMEGIQRRFSTGEACRQALLAGSDLWIIANNLKREGPELGHIARQLRALVRESREARERHGAALCRILRIKELTPWIPATDEVNR